MQRVSEQPVILRMNSLVSRLIKMALLTNAMFTKYRTFPYALFCARGCHLITTVDDVTFMVHDVSGRLAWYRSNRNTQMTACSIIGQQGYRYPHNIHIICYWL